MLKFYVKVFKTIYFLNPEMDLVYSGWLGGAKVSCIFCHPGLPADIG